MALPDPGVVPSPTPTPVPTSPPGFIPVSTYLIGCKSLLNNLSRTATYTADEVGDFLDKQIVTVKASEL